MPLSEQARQCIEELLEGNEIDVIEFPDYDALGLPFQKANPHFPTVVRLHGDSELCYRGNLSRMGYLIRIPIRALRPPRTWRLERESVELASVVSAPTQWSLRSGERRGWRMQSPEVVPNPFLGWNRAGDRSGRPAGCKRILFLGRVDYRKGAEMLPDVLIQLFKLHPNAQVDVIGQVGRRRSREREPYDAWVLRKLPRHYRASVHFKGGISYADIPACIEQHGIAVFMSTWESFGYTHVECMYEGVACVIASRGGARELGVHLESVMYVERSPASIAAGVSRLLVDSQLRNTIAVEGARTVRERFGGEDVFRTTAELYRRAVKNSAPSRVLPANSPQ